MVQGGKFKAAKPVKKGSVKKVVHSKKQSEFNKRSNKPIVPKDARRLHNFKVEQKLSKTINANIEKLMAGKVIQAGERLNLTDVKVGDLNQEPVKPRTSDSTLCCC